MRSVLGAPVPQTSRHIHNYSVDAGQGSQTFATSAAFRRALLGTAAAGALFFGYGRRAYAQVVPNDPQCPVSGTTVNCTGDLSEGVAVSPAGYTTLNVNSLTANIAPASGTSGIVLANIAGSVTINSDTENGPGGPFAIVTTGNDARGIDAYAGSGTASVVHSGDITTSGNRSYGIRAYASGAADVTQNGDITTSGFSADGIYAFSDADSVTVDQTGDITTTGPGAYGIHAIAFGDVDVTQTGTITTSEDASIGILAFSFSNSGTATVHQSGDVNTTGNFAYGIVADGFNAADVTHENGSITTGGAFSHGILAASYAGSATVTNTGDVTTTGYNSLGIIADGDASASVTQFGNVTTSGDYADAIYAISDSGGAMVDHQMGNIITRGYAAYGIHVTANDAITVTNTGDINTSGDFADGIYVTSNSSATTTITQTGDITVTGDGSDGIDVNQNGNGSSLVTIAAGSTITGGTGSGDGIDFDGDGTNHVVNYGTITTLGENAIEGEGPGLETIDNYGTVTGNVDLDVDLYGGVETFNNQIGAQFNAGSVINLGSGLLTNAGTLDPGGSGAVQSTTLTGDLEQTSDGIFAVDIDGTTSDFVDVTGTADLAGTVAPHLIDLSTTDYLILDSAGGTTNSGLTVNDTLTVDFDLAFAPGEEVHLLINSVNFVVTGLNRNQTNIATHLNDVFSAGIGGLGPVLAGLGNLQTVGQLANALDQLSPEIYGDTQLSALYASLNFSSELLGCKVNGADTAAINREGECLWVSAKARFLDNDETFENIGFDETAGLFTTGAQLALDPVWRLGFGLSYQNSRLETATNATSEGDMLQGGVALKYNPGPLMLAGVVSGGRAWYDTTRPMAFSTFSETAEGDHTVDILSGRLHASYVLGAPSLYFKPMIDAAVNRLDLGGFSETGAGGANLVVNSQATTVFNVSPALELGTEWWLANGTLMRPFLRAGVTWFSDTDVNLVASFAGTPAGVSPFTIRSEIDEVQADVAAGLEVINSEDSVLRFTYDGQLGETTQIHSFALRGSIKF